jgi:hypothetical protein
MLMMINLALLLVLVGLTIPSHFALELICEIEKEPSRYHITRKEISPYILRFGIDNLYEILYNERNYLMHFDVCYDKIIYQITCISK